jgi:hypothetical protein
MILHLWEASSVNLKKKQMRIFLRAFLRARAHAAQHWQQSNRLTLTQSAQFLLGPAKSFSDLKILQEITKIITTTTMDTKSPKTKRRIVVKMTQERFNELEPNSPFLRKTAVRLGSKSKLEKLLMKDAKKMPVMDLDHSESAASESIARIRSMKEVIEAYDDVLSDSVPPELCKTSSHSCYSEMSSSSHSETIKNTPCTKASSEHGLSEKQVKKAPVPARSLLRRKSSDKDAKAAGVQRGVERSPSRRGVERSPSRRGVERSPSRRGIERSPSSSLMRSISRTGSFYRKEKKQETPTAAATPSPPAKSKRDKMTRTKSFSEKAKRLDKNIQEKKKQEDAPPSPAPSSRGVRRTHSLSMGAFKSMTDILSEYDQIVDELDKSIGSFAGSSFSSINKEELEGLSASAPNLTYGRHHQQQQPALASPVTALKRTRSVKLNGTKSVDSLKHLLDNTGLQQRAN